MTETIEAALEVRIEASPERVWKAVTEKTTDWWPEGFYMGKDPKGMIIEARPGGRMFEDGGEGQGLLWGTVIQVRANELLQFAGVLTPEFGGPAHLITTWKFSADGDATRLRVTDVAFGCVSEKTKASLEKGWKVLLHDSLKPHVERSG